MPAGAAASPTCRRPGGPTAGGLGPLATAHIRRCKCNPPAAVPPGSKPSNRVGDLVIAIRGRWRPTTWAQNTREGFETAGAPAPALPRAAPQPRVCGMPRISGCFDKGRAPSGPPHRPLQPSCAPRHPLGGHTPCLQVPPSESPNGRNLWRAQGALLPELQRPSCPTNNR